MQLYQNMHIFFRVKDKKMDIKLMNRKITSLHSFNSTRQDGHLHFELSFPFFQLPLFIIALYQCKGIKMYSFRNF